MSNRLRGWLVAVSSVVYLVIGACLFVLPVFLWFVLTFWDANADIAPALAISVLSLGLSTTAFVVFARRTAFRDAKLEVTDQSVVISDPRGLGKRVAVGLEHIRAVEIFDPYVLSEYPQVERLHSGADGNPQVPVLPMGGRRGNLAVLFNAPVELVHRARVPGSKGRRVITRYAVSGLILSASKPAKAREQLAELGVRTTITPADVDASFKTYKLDPGPAADPWAKLADGLGASL